MYRIPLPDIKQKLLISGKISAEDIEERIKEKINELSGLISEEGAAHIIANELGVELQEVQEQLKIKQVYAGMRNITIAGKVVRKFEVREFSKEGKQGKVASLLLGDETGTARVVFWNTQVDVLDELSEDDIILIKNVYVKENRGGREIHLGERSELKINPEGIVISSVRQGTAYTRKSINELQEGEEGVELMGTIVQVFDPRFFEVHPETGKRIQPGEQVTPALSYVMNLILDDGTGTIRSVFWKNQTSHLTGKTEEEMAQFKEDLQPFESIKTDLLGEQLKLMGKVTKNQMFDRLEFNVQMVEKATPEEELKRLEAK